MSWIAGNPSADSTMNSGPSPLTTEIAAAAMTGRRLPGAPPVGDSPARHDPARRCHRDRQHDEREQDTDQQGEERDAERQHANAIPERRPHHRDGAGNGEGKRPA